MKKLIFLLCIMSLLSGCASLTPRAKQPIVISEYYGSTSNIKARITILESDLFSDSVKFQIFVTNNSPAAIRTNIFKDSIYAFSNDKKTFAIDFPTSGYRLEYKGQAINPNDSLYAEWTINNNVIASLFKNGQITEIFYTIGLHEIKIRMKKSYQKATVPKM